MGTCAGTGSPWRGPRAGAWWAVPLPWRDLSRDQALPPGSADSLRLLTRCSSLASAFPSLSLLLTQPALRTALPVA